MSEAHEKAVERLAAFLINHDRSDVRGLQPGDMRARLDREVEVQRRMEATEKDLGYDDPSRFDEAKEEAAQIMIELGLVAVDPALVEAAERTRAACDGELATEKYIGSGETIAELTEYGDACSRLADAVLAQVKR